MEFKYKLRIFGPKGEVVNTITRTYPHELTPEQIKQDEDWENQRNSSAGPIDRLANPSLDTRLGRTTVRNLGESLTVRPAASIASLIGTLHDLNAGRTLDGRPISPEERSDNTRNLLGQLSGVSRWGQNIAQIRGEMGEVSKAKDKLEGASQYLYQPNDPNQQEYLSHVANMGEAAADMIPGVGATAKSIIKNFRQGDPGSAVGDTIGAIVSPKSVISGARRVARFARNFGRTTKVTSKAPDINYSRIAELTNSVRGVTKPLPDLGITTPIRDFAKQYRQIILANKLKYGDPVSLDMLRNAGMTDEILDVGITNGVIATDAVGNTTIVPRKQLTTLTRKEQLANLNTVSSNADLPVAAKIRYARNLGLSTEDIGKVFKVFKVKKPDIRIAVSGSRSTYVEPVNRESILQAVREVQKIVADPNVSYPIAMDIMRQGQIPRNSAARIGRGLYGKDFKPKLSSIDTEEFKHLRVGDKLRVETLRSMLQDQPYNLDVIKKIESGEMQVPANIRAKLDEFRLQNVIAGGEPGNIQNWFPRVWDRETIKAAKGFLSTPEGRAAIAAKIGRTPGSLRARSLPLEVVEELGIKPGHNNMGDALAESLGGTLRNTRDKQLINYLNQNNLIGPEGPNVIPGRVMIGGEGGRTSPIAGLPKPPKPGEQAIPQFMDEDTLKTIGNIIGANDWTVAKPLKMLGDANRVFKNLRFTSGIPVSRELSINTGEQLAAIRDAQLRTGIATPFEHFKNRPSMNLEQLQRAMDAGAINYYPWEIGESISHKANPKYPRLSRVAHGLDKGQKRFAEIFGDPTYGKKNKFDETGRIVERASLEDQQGSLNRYAARNYDDAVRYHIDNGLSAEEAAKRAAKEIQRTFNTYNFSDMNPSAREFLGGITTSMPWTAGRIGSGIEVGRALLGKPTYVGNRLLEAGANQAGISQLPGVINRQLGNEQESRLGDINSIPLFSDSKGKDVSLTWGASGDPGFSATLLKAFERSANEKNPVSAGIGEAVRTASNRISPAIGFGSALAETDKRTPLSKTLPKAALNATPPQLDALGNLILGNDSPYETASKIGELGFLRFGRPKKARFSGSEAEPDFDSWFK